jgi:hypothetical protein
MHDEFLLQYQLPILRSFGLVAYGCCEDLTRKIDMLRQVPNLRHIAVTLVADVRRCAEQIGRDYVTSWRPNPTDMVCASWDEARIRRIVRDGMEAMESQSIRCSRPSSLLPSWSSVGGDTQRTPDPAPRTWPRHRHPAVLVVARKLASRTHHTGLPRQRRATLAVPGVVIPDLALEHAPAGNRPQP